MFPKDHAVATGSFARGAGIWNKNSRFFLKPSEGLLLDLLLDSLMGVGARRFQKPEQLVLRFMKVPYYTCTRFGDLGHLSLVLVMYSG